LCLGQHAVCNGKRGELNNRGVHTEQALASRLGRQ
jgi:hypothetical protein